MNIIRKYGLSLAICCAALVAHTRIYAADLETKLTASRVVGAGETEKYVDAANAAPGAVIRYVATFSNTTARGLSQVAATLPIPGGLELILSSVKPAATEGSVDGKVFVPLKRLLAPKAEGGLGVKPAAVRALRWAPRDIASHAEFSVEARAKVSANQASP